MKRKLAADAIQPFCEPVDEIKSINDELRKVPYYRNCLSLERQPHIYQTNSEKNFKRSNHKNSERKPEATIVIIKICYQ